jgi:hypothetical protein
MDSCRRRLSGPGGSVYRAVSVSIRDGSQLHGSRRGAVVRRRCATVSVSNPGGIGSPWCRGLWGVVAVRSREGSAGRTRQAGRGHSCSWLPGALGPWAVLAVTRFGCGAVRLAGPGGLGPVGRPRRCTGRPGRAVGLGGARARAVRCRPARASHAGAPPVLQRPKRRCRGIQRMWIASRASSCSRVSVAASRRCREIHSPSRNRRPACSAM